MDGGPGDGTMLRLTHEHARPYEFLHLMSFADAAAEQAHASSDAVPVFTEALYPMCVEPPTFEEWHAVWERGSRGEP